MLRQAKELAVAVCTVGLSLKKEVTDYTSQGELLRSILVDGADSAAVDPLETGYDRKMGYAGKYLTIVNTM